MTEYVQRLDEYQKRAAQTAAYPGRRGLEYLTLGLASEAGEIAGKAKKIIRGDYKLTPAQCEQIAEELGDVLWYTAMLANHLGFSLSDIASMNVGKLHDRAKRGTIKGEGDQR